MKRLPPFRSLARLAILAALAAAFDLTAAGPVLRESDVVFMYEGSRETYEAYGTTVLAWGGTPNPKSREAARGIRFFGSVGMVTEFSAYHRRNRDRYEEGLCRDLEGKPVKVPWLVDHRSDSVPYWWCCTRQPLFRQFLRDRVVETVRAGADGLHVDDHLGTAGGLWLGLCFCDRCVEGFGPYLAGSPAATHLPSATGDFREEARRWLAAAPGRKVTGHPLWADWTVYQGRGAAAFMQELRELAVATAGRPIPVGANAGLLWPRHLADYQALDLFTAETDHHARERKFADLPLFAYRIAEGMGRPYAATASGADWAYVKEHQLPGLVRGWIALSYAAGQRLMAPHHQWCHTPEKGTHWYDGPADRFAPLYRFVRRHPDLFDGFATRADLAVVLPHAAFLRNPQPWFDLGHRLAAANLSYRLLVAGDALVDHPLPTAELAAARFVLAPDRTDLLPDDMRRLNENTAQARMLDSVDAALAAVTPAVRPVDSDRVRVLVRTKTGQAVVHVLHWDYDASRDDVVPLRSVRLRCDPAALGVPGARTARWITPDNDPVEVPLRDGIAELADVGLWGLLVIGAP
jgi:hypothetical protein